MKRLYGLREEINLCLIHKNNDVPKLSDPEWIMDLAFLVDVTGHLNMLNCKLQGKNVVINEAFDMIQAFEARLQLWADQL